MNLTLVDKPPTDCLSEITQVCLYNIFIHLRLCNLFSVRHFPLKFGDTHLWLTLTFIQGHI